VKLRERLLNTADAGARLLLVENWLLERCASGRQVHPLVHWATRRLADSAGKVRVSELARDAGCSRKHVVELFGREVGLAPKALARVHRFQHALRSLREGTRPLAEIALDCGYYDQSHLVHDCRQFAGMPPHAFARAAMPDPNSVVVG
jgi:AraC-like DNA-binding protein